MYVCSHIELSLRLSFMLGVFLFGYCLIKNNKLFKYLFLIKLNANKDKLLVSPK